MRMGLFGAGRIGRIHARNLAAIEGVSELLIADPVADVASDVAAAVGAKRASVADVLDGCDAVIVAAASDAHGELIRAAVARGLPVFCEKPLAPSLEEAIDLADAVEAAGIAFQLGFMRRFDAGYVEARRLVETGAIGTLYCVGMTAHDPEPPHESYIPVSGGLFRDFSGHDFDILRWLTGREVVEVYADGSVREFPMFEKYGDVDTATAMLRLDDGTLAAMTITRDDALGYDIRTDLFGSKDSISVGMGPRQPVRSVEPGVPPPAGPAWPDFEDRFAPAYRAEMERFLMVAKGLEPSPCSARDGVAAARIAEAATMSLQEHRPVRLSEIAGGADVETGRA